MLLCQKVEDEKLEKHSLLSKYTSFWMICTTVLLYAEVRCEKREINIGRGISRHSNSKESNQVIPISKAAHERSSKCPHFRRLLSSFVTLLGLLVLAGWNYKIAHILRVHTQSESHKCDLDRIKVQALAEHLNAQHHGEMEKIYFRELDRQMIKKKRGL